MQSTTVLRDLLNMIPMGTLPFLLLLPLLGAIVAFMSGEHRARYVGVAATLVELILSLAMLSVFDPALDSYEAVTYTVLVMGTIMSEPIAITLGVDGISVVLVLLANLVMFVAILSASHIEHSQKSFYSLMLLLQTGLVGVFISTNLIGFFLFWELVLIPMFFVIGEWGEEGAQHAAVKFFVYTQIGSLAMLIGFFAVFVTAGSLDMLRLRTLMSTVPLEIQVLFAIAVFLGAGVKLPVWPFHNWLPYAHVKAPTPGSVVLAGILLKMGGYAFVRLGLWLNAGAFFRLAVPFALLAVFTCIYAAFTAMAQGDLKSLVAYTSINHMAWVLLGVAAGSQLAIVGAVFMMFSHGAIISVLFIVAGLLKHSAGSRMIDEVSGLGSRAPRLSGVFVLASLAAFGLPTLSGFVAEVLILFGSIQVFVWSGLIAFGIFVTVGYFLWTLNRMVYSEGREDRAMSDASLSDLVAPAVMLVFVVALGVWPDLILVIISEAVSDIAGVVP
ncbi:MAG: NADH-quinone oxidoreductase subunit M [Candidatus Thorarchaeota archaeon]